MQTLELSTSPCQKRNNKGATRRVNSHSGKRWCHLMVGVLGLKGAGKSTLSPVSFRSTFKDNSVISFDL